jgi:crotonobetainyl-CoA:carnitine CoA-transferase CaiB-like acyl-CoA transferase
VPALTPLDGVRVLDLTRLLPGAYATLMLADLGAEVIKIEDPRGGDGMRTLRLSGDRPYFELLNRNKRSVTLDLRSRDAPPVLHALVATADVVVDSFRPSTARRLRVDAATLRAKHPRLVCASIIGFARNGPRAETPGHDLNYQALAGLVRPPDIPGPLVSDVGAAAQAAIAILAALFERQRTGTGRAVDITLEAAAEAWTLFPTGRELESACYTLYETADGEWLALGALEAKFWEAFCNGIGRADLIPLQHARGDTGDRVLRDVRAVIRTRTRDDWMARFADADVCLTPVEHPRRQTPTVEGGPASAPALSADTDVVLEGIGIGEVARADLRARGVI